MPSLRHQLIAFTETLSAMTVSAEDRYRDGEQLLVGGRHRGAVYLLGLSAETWLKLACYRLVGARAADPVGPHAHRVSQYMATSVPTVAKESGHSLLFWAEFLVRFGRTQGTPPTAEQAGRLRHHVSNRAFLDWKIEIRYRPALVSAAADRRVLADVTWLRHNWHALGR
jgi:hypothetical protein